MKNANFKDWTLTQLDKIFGLTQILATECEILQEWQLRAEAVEISEFEKQALLTLQAPLIWAGKAWNETELENKFISPLMMIARIDDRKIGYFLERPLSGIVGEYELSGIVDGMIATGLRDPDIPYFCMHEYKRSVDNAGNPDGQTLVAMLAARELNNNQKPLYGLYIVGTIWNFMVLNPGNSYCVSQNYDGSDNDIFGIFKIIKALKGIIQEDLNAQ